MCLLSDRLVETMPVISNSKIRLSKDDSKTSRTRAGGERGGGVSHVVAEGERERGLEAGSEVSIVLVYFHYRPSDKPDSKVESISARSNS